VGLVNQVGIVCGLKEQLTLTHLRNVGINPDSNLVPWNNKLICMPKRVNRSPIQQDLTINFNNPPGTPVIVV